MNKVLLNIFVIMSLLFLFIPTILFAVPTEKSLIEAWESFQKQDPKNLIFEKISKNRYRFKTERFPFDGELKILNVTVDEQISGFEGGFILGVVEIELINLPKDFLEKYSYSYSAWIQDNILYYDTEEEKWLSDDEYYGRMKEKIPTSFFLDILNTGAVPPQDYPGVRRILTYQLRHPSGLLEVGKDKRNANVIVSFL